MTAAFNFKFPPKSKNGLSPIVQSKWWQNFYRGLVVDLADDLSPIKEKWSPDLVGFW